MRFFASLRLQTSPKAFIQKDKIKRRKAMAKSPPMLDIEQRKQTKEAGKERPVK